MLAAVAADLGLPADAAARIAAPFGGGMGRSGEVCGAASGGLMALGLRYGPTDASDRAGKEAAYRVARAFLAEFRSRNGALRCRDLLGCDIGVPEEYARAREAGLFKAVCPRAVTSAAEIVSRLLAEGPESEG